MHSVDRSSSQSCGSIYHVPHCVWVYFYLLIVEIILGFYSVVILRLHYVPGGHGGHVSDNREQNGITVRQRRGTG